MAKQPEKRQRGPLARRLMVIATPSATLLDLDALAEQLVPYVRELVEKGVLTIIDGVMAVNPQYVDWSAEHAHPMSRHTCKRCGERAVFARGRTHWCLTHALEEMMCDAIERGHWKKER